MNREFYQKLCTIVGEEQILTEEPMKKHTTFRIGGSADFLVLPRTSQEIAEVTALCRREGEPWYVIGNGSNLLVSDKGVRGVVIRLLHNFNKIEVRDEEVHAQAGAVNAAVARKALDAGLTGFEFAAGLWS